jgi:hypothetical protein
LRSDPNNVRNDFETPELKSTLYGIRKNSSIDLVSDFLVDQKVEDEI